MKKSITILTFILLVNLMFAQKEKTIYLQESMKFTYPDMCIKAKIPAIVKVTFDVVNLKAQNIRFETNKQGMFELINEATISNIDSLIFVNDTIGYTLTIDYVLKENVSNNYIEYIEPGHIKAIFRRSDTTIREFIIYSVICDESNLSITATGWVHTYKPINKKSNILVELFFVQDSVNVLILENNLPSLEDKIIEASKHLSRLFQNNEAKCDYFIPQKYFLKLKVVRWFGEGNYYKTY